MYNRILSAFNIKNLWLFLPIFLVSLYGVQGIVGILIFKSQAASQFVVIFTLGILTYLLTYILLRKYWQDLPLLERITGPYQLPVDWWIKAISAAYFLLMIYTIASSEKIALWEAINGASSTDIAYAREVLFKARTGWEQTLVYLNALFSSALMPYVLVVCYLEKKSYRHVLLTLFVVSMLPSLEKALVIKAFLPLIVVAFSGYLSRRSGYLFIALMLAIIMGTTYLSKMGRINADSQVHENQQITSGVLTKLIHQAQQNLRILQAVQTKGNHQISEADLAKLTQQAQQNLQILQAVQTKGNHQVSEADLAKLIQYLQQAIHAWQCEQAFQVKFSNKYQPFGTSNQVTFMLNRILWIPYITAYDWLGYFLEKMHDEYLNGRTSMLVSRLTGQQQFPMEKEVFIYQFGADGPTTAAANATFLVDAYVNFGWFGVVLFSALFATLTRLVDWLNNPATKACYYYFAFQLAVGGLFGVLFSNGLLLLLVLALFMKPKVLDKYLDPTDKSIIPKAT